MRFKISHGDYPSLSFYLHSATPEVEAQIDRLGPHKIITQGFDWPNEFPYHGWAEKLNSLRWPRDLDQFASLIITLDDTRAAIIDALMASQATTIKTPAETKNILVSLAFDNRLTADNQITSATLSTPGSLALSAATIDADAATVSFDASGGTDETSYLCTINATLTDGTLITSYAGVYVSSTSTVVPRPYVILQALLSPPEGGRPGETYAPAGITVPVVVETELMAWKLYPLAPVRLPETWAGDRFQGLWLLPLVDERYFSRLTPVYSLDADDAVDFPTLDINHRDPPPWMPDLVQYPDDLLPPASYVAIEEQGTSNLISGTTSLGRAADIQSLTENWRIVNRDVRSNYNHGTGPGAPHTDFTGTLCDYPDDPTTLGLTSSYHEDAIRMARYPGALISGGMTNPWTAAAAISHKLHFLFRVISDESYYGIVTQRDVPDPLAVADISEDTAGPSTAELAILPKVVIGPEANTRDATDDNRDILLDGAKQWSLLYYLWRRRQAYFKFAGIVPVMPNGYASIIEWNFSSTDFSTIYVANESVEGTPDLAGELEGSTSGDFPVRFVQVTDAIDDESGFYPAVVVRQEDAPTVWPEEEECWLVGANSETLVVDQQYLARAGNRHTDGLVIWSTMNGGQSDTAFVRVTSTTKVNGQIYPAVRLQNSSTPHTDWPTLETCWFYNVRDVTPSLIYPYLCKRNDTQFLGLDQWDTSDCCDAGDPPDDCCGSPDQLCLTITSACPCLDGQMVLLSKVIFLGIWTGHWVGDLSLRDSGCASVDAVGSDPALAIFDVICNPSGFTMTVNIPDQTLSISPPGLKYCVPYGELDAYGNSMQKSTVTPVGVQSCDPVNAVFQGTVRAKNYPYSPDSCDCEGMTWTGTLGPFTGLSGGCTSGSGSGGSSACYLLSGFNGILINVPKTFVGVFGVISGTCPGTDGLEVDVNFYTTTGTGMLWFSDIFTLNGHNAYVAIDINRHGAGILSVYWEATPGGAWDFVEGIASYTGGVWSLLVENIGTGDGCVADFGGTFDTADCA